MKEEATMLRNSLFTTVMISLAFLGACTSTTGTKISDEQVAKIQKGITTKADINSMWGNPSSTTVDASGKERWVFTYHEHKWLLGAPPGPNLHWDRHSQSLIVTFTGDKVDNYFFSKIDLPQ